MTPEEQVESLAIIHCSGILELSRPRRVTAGDVSCVVQTATSQVNAGHLVVMQATWRVDGRQTGYPEGELASTRIGVELVVLIPKTAPHAASAQE